MIMILIDGYSGVQSVLASPAQRPLFCPCGRDFPWTAGLCRGCYRASPTPAIASPVSAMRSSTGTAVFAGPAGRAAASMCITASRASMTATG